MKLEKEILINLYGQDLVEILILSQEFIGLDLKEKRIYLDELAHLILQSKAVNSDVKPAIHSSGLKETFTPCVVLFKGGVEPHVFHKIINLPENELEKVLVILLNLFKIAYKRRYEAEKNNPQKWWYWDLSRRENIEAVKRLTS